ncbi:MAG: hypothetical protein KGJ41_10165 [Rhodospirillales bacterium]|nr:hypothetical protein [Rhodospirillales bacterium]MDE2199376.1 hypothetical protein [Rhodospirillales bacterium]
MIPGISEPTAARLADLLDRRATDLRPDALAAREVTLLAADEPAAARLGVTCEGGAAPLLIVTDPDRKLGAIRVQAGGPGHVLAFDNARWSGSCFANIRLPGTDCLLLFGDIGEGYVAIHDLFMRSDGQILIWGEGATAVGLSVEIEGPGRAVVIGDDALISSGVWIRNYDMHAVHDLRSGAQINRPPMDTVIERHVWIGQEALLLSCERVGMGGVVGARSVLKGCVPPRVAVGGIPARVLREEVSWGRHPYGMTASERAAIAAP